MDDIVERLRAEAKELDHVRGDLLDEAAAEITRLRSAAPGGRDVQEMSHYCLDCSRQWFGDDPKCPDQRCPFKTASSTGGDQP